MYMYTRKLYSTSVGRTPAGPGNFRLTRFDVGACCGVENTEGGGTTVENVRVKFLWIDGVCDRRVESGWTVGVEVAERTWGAG